MLIFPTSLDALSIIRRPCAVARALLAFGASHAAAACPALAPALQRALVAATRRAVVLLVDLQGLGIAVLVRRQCCAAPPGRTKAPPRSMAPPWWRWCGPGGGAGDRASCGLVDCEVNHGY